MNRRKLVAAFFVSVVINNLILFAALAAMLINSSLGEVFYLWKEVLSLWVASVSFSTLVLYFWGSV